MTRIDSSASGPFGADHPTVAWVRREVLPLVIEHFAPQRVIVFDPPDRPVQAGEHPPGLVVVSDRFQGVGMLERRALLIGRLSAASPVRPFCLTRSEYDAIDSAPGPLLGAVKAGVRIL